ncbi:MAG: 6,7-dimethyl-8-ribityllumazine synthase [Bdellovibrionales bacterium]
MSNPPHILIVESRFYDEISDPLLQGTIETLEFNNATYDVVTVPGALETPAAVQFAATNKDNKHYDAYIALGCVIRGETTHYETVCNESCRGLTDVALKHNLAIGNGILTVENKEQAMDRADKNKKNKGGGAARAALAMYKLKQKYKLA